MFNPLDYILVALAALAAGAVNALAGGGTLITFPVLTAVGIPAVAANMTNTVALCPGYLGGTLSQRKDLQGQAGRLWLFIPAGIVGGLLGGLLLHVTKESVFRGLVPYLILIAAGLLLSQERVRAWLRPRTQAVASATLPAHPIEEGSLRSRRRTQAAESSPADHAFPAGDQERCIQAAASPTGSLTGSPTGSPTGSLIGSPTDSPTRTDLWAVLPVGLTAIYLGYFGAGASVIVLAILGIVLDDSLTRLNALKQAISLSANVAAAVYFLFLQKIVWPVALVMFVGALLGGALGGKLAGRVKPDVLRYIVVVIGVVVAIIYLLR